MSVDDFWRQLNVKKASSVRLSGLTDIPGLTRQSRTLPTQSAQLTKTTTPSPKPAVAATVPEQQHLQAAIQRDINCLTDQDRTLRYKACAVHGHLLVNLTRLLADPVEKCREGAILLLRSAAEQLPDPAAILPSLIPAVVERMGDTPVVEPSEELRLGLIDLIGGPVITRCAQQLGPYLGMVVQVVCRSLEDAFHKIKKAGGTAIANLCSQITGIALESQHETLLASLLPNLSHQHSRVRSATLTAVDILVTKGIKEELMTSVIAPAVRPLVSDRAPAMKQQCFAVLANWLGASGSYAIELLPSLLLGLTDEAADVRVSTMERLNQIAEHQDISTEQRQRQAMLTSSLQLQMTEERVMSNGDASTSDPPCQWPGGFTYPYQASPPSALIRLVRGVLPAILPITVLQLKDWTVLLRINAARSLQSTLLLAGDATSKHLPHLLGPLCSAAGDEDPEIATHVVQAAQVVGAFVKLNHWLPIMLDAVTAPQASLTTRVNTLVVLSAMLYASGVVHQRISSEQLELLVNALCSDTVRGADQGPAQLQLLAVVSNTISLAGGQCEAVSQQLWLLLLQLQGSRTSSSLSASACQTSQLLAEACGMQLSADLAGLHAPALMRQAAQTPDCHVFSVLLRQCPPATLKTLATCILGIAAGILQDPEREPALQVHMLQLLDSILANPEQAAAFSEQASLQLCNDVLLPPLVWRAGKAAAAVRFAAITALSTFFAQSLLQTDQLQHVLEQEQLLRMLFQSLEEEYFVETRFAACNAAYHMLSTQRAQFSSEQCRMIYPELLKRLDDSSNEVRASVCHALAGLCQSSHSSLDDTNVNYLIDGMLVHMDDTDQIVQEAVFSALVLLAASRPKLVKQAVMKVQQLHRSDRYTSRLLLACTL